MIRYVLGSKASCKTARAIAKKISELQGRRCFYYQRMPRRRWLRSDGVRWGNLSVGARPINRLINCKIAANKLYSLQRLANVGVSVPKIVSESPFGWIADDNFPLVFRKSHRRGGNDNPYVVMKKRNLDTERAAQYDYAVKWIRKAQEYRVHVFDGQVILCQIKKKRRGVEHDRMIRSESRGWVLCECEAEQELGALAVHAVYCLGLAFGAVDICLERDTGTPYVLEVNTAPGLKDDNVAIYAAHLIAYALAHARRWT